MTTGSGVRRRTVRSHDAGRARPRVQDLVNRGVRWSIADGVDEIVLDREPARNAIDQRTANELLDATTAAAGAPGLLALLVRTTGPVCSVGGTSGCSRRRPPAGLPATLSI